MTTNTQHSTTHEAGTTVHVAPTDLLLQRNIRTVPRDDAFKDLVRSIAEVGVLEPIVAVTTQTSDGTTALLVRFGERRTLAAIEAKRDTVPVYVAGTDSTETEAEVARIITQRDENTHRAGLTTAEEIGVVEQLAAFGLTAAQIAKKARIKRDEVETSLAVSKSKIARKATERYDTLTLDQAAVVAEFEDDPETVKALVVAAHKGEFEHVAQEARDARIEAHVRDTVLAALAEAGVTVIDRPAYGDTTTKELSDLRVSETDHTGCPGHVAWLTSAYRYVDLHGDLITFPPEPADDADDAAWEAHETEVETLKTNSRRMWLPSPEYGCQNWRKHGHVDPFATSKPKAAEMSAEEREKAKADRRLVIENNKAWASAEQVRRDWIAATLAKAKTPPKGTAAFIATALCRDSHVAHSTGGNHLAAAWLGKKSTGYGHIDLSPAKTTTENRALVLALVQILGGYEDAIAENSWRSDGTNNATGRYLRFLQSAGYTLSEVEKYAISNKTV